MKIKYLGTAAAEGVPAIFCNCDTCQRARKAGGRNIRTRSQAMIDGKILIDFPSDTYLHMLRDGESFADLEYCLITHAHMDHFYTSEINCRKVGFGHPIVPTLHFYATEPGCRKFESDTANEGVVEQGRVALHEIEPFKPFMIEDYKITPLKAAHDPKSGPVIYLIEHDGQAILYAHDTGTLPEETMEFFRNYKGKLSLLSLDGTCGIIDDDYYGHMTIPRDRALRKEFEALGIVDEKTVFVLNHFSHNGRVTYDELCEIVKDEGFVVSYDTLEIAL